MGWMTFEYLMCRENLNFEVDFGIYGAIGTIVTKWDLIVFGYCIVFIHNICIFCIFLNSLHSPLRTKSAKLDIQKIIICAYLQVAKWQPYLNSNSSDLFVHIRRLR